MREEEGRDKIDAFKRPCHLVGLRLGFPPYTVEDDDSDTDKPEASDQTAPDPPIDEGSDWQAIITLLTLDDDPTKLLVEITGTWQEPFQWSGIHDTIQARLNIASDFLRSRVSGFLGHFEGGDDAREN
jgi:hypothetical protein